MSVEWGATSADTRPLSPYERTYLEERRERVVAALKSLWLVLGFLGLPVLFVSSSASITGDRFAWTFAAFIISLLVLLMLNYSAKESRHPRLTWRDWQMPQLLEEDLRLGEVKVIAGVATRKGETQWKPGWHNLWGLVGRLAGHIQRRPLYWVEVAERRYELSAAHFMACAAGDRLTLEVASQSGVVLGVNGAPQRLSFFQVLAEG